ncbi:MAG: DUF3253 domain-containing protein [Elioraea sp.]|nr:DUF3253 domain-containing protein [Elioraea sp.]MDW8444675.1 DUF3253 domain-containing protein [Acetobacteraceae bacterium]
MSGSPVEPGAIAEAILRLCAERGPGKSICPSEVARALAGDDERVWRLLMHPVRREAFRLAEAGRIEVLRKGKPIRPGEAKGVIRLRIRNEPEAA